MGDLSLTGSTVMFLFLGLLVLTIAIIFAYRAYIKKQQDSDLSTKYDDNNIRDYLKSRNKYPEADVMRKTTSIFGYGLATALALTLFAFSWTRYEKVVVIPDDALEFDEEIEQEPPRTAEPPPPPPPPPPEQFEKVEDDVEIEEVVIQTTDVELEDVIDIEAVEYSDEGEEVTYEDVPFAAIQNPAIFPGCEKAKDKKKCFSDKVNKYISRNFDIGLAEELGLSGVQRMAAMFKIDINGKVTEVRVRAKNAELQKEFERTLKGLPQMVPASQNGRKVNLLFSLPLVFRVE